MFKINFKTPERRHWRRSDVFFVNFKHISHLSIVDFEQVSVRWSVFLNMKESFWA